MEKDGEGWGAHSLLGASDIGAIGELPAVPTFIPSCVQGGHAGAGDRSGTCSGGRDPQHLYLAPSTPAQPCSTWPQQLLALPLVGGTGPAVAACLPTSTGLPILQECVSRAVR